MAGAICVNVFAASPALACGGSYNLHPPVFHNVSEVGDLSGLQYNLQGLAPNADYELGGINSVAAREYPAAIRTRASTTMQGFCS